MSMGRKLDLFNVVVGFKLDTDTEHLLTKHLSHPSLHYLQPLNLLQSTRGLYRRS